MKRKVLFALPDKLSPDICWLGQERPATSISSRRVIRADQVPDLSSYVPPAGFEPAISSFVAKRLVLWTTAAETTFDPYAYRLFPYLSKVATPKRAGRLDRVFAFLCL
jgi:hypothetical protein